MKITKFLRVFFLFDNRNEMSNSSYILNINYNIKKNLQKYILHPI